MVPGVKHQKMNKNQLSSVEGFYYEAPAGRDEFTGKAGQHKNSFIVLKKNQLMLVETFKSRMLTVESLIC